MKKADALKTIGKIIIAGTAAMTLFSITLTGFNNRILSSEMKKQLSVPITYDLKTAEIKTSEEYEVNMNVLSSVKGKTQYSSGENSMPILFNEEKAQGYYSNKSDKYIILAEEFAKKIYGIEVVSSEFDGVSALLAKAGINLKSNPEELPAARLYISVKITDTEGIMYEVTINEETKLLQSISIIKPFQGNRFS